MTASWSVGGGEILPEEKSIPCEEVKALVPLVRKMADEMTQLFH
jgi:hypothetical protein